MGSFLAPAAVAAAAAASSASFLPFRAMDFILTFLDLLEAHPDWTAFAVAKEAYEHALQPYHGWITRQAFGVSNALVHALCIASSALHVAVGFPPRSSSSVDIR